MRALQQNPYYPGSRYSLQVMLDTAVVHSRRFYTQSPSNRRHILHSPSPTKIALKVKVRKRS